MPKERKQTLTRSYFYKYIENLPYNYCPCCDDLILINGYINKHLTTRKHKLHVTRLNSFITENNDKFSIEDVALLNEVLDKYPIFCTEIKI